MTSTRLPNWVAPLFAGAALLLLPWVALLLAVLPSSRDAAHWDIAWFGFDVALALLLFSVAVTAYRQSPWLEDAATATTALLFVDAWFDILTSSTGSEVVVATIEAAFVELPTALLCLMLARRAHRSLQSANGTEPPFTQSWLNPRTGAIQPPAGEGTGLLVLVDAHGSDTNPPCSHLGHGYIQLTL